MFFHSFIAMEYAFTLFLTVNSSINAAGDHLAGGSFPKLCTYQCKSRGGGGGGVRARGGDLMPETIPAVGLLIV